MTERILSFAATPGWLQRFSLQLVCGGHRTYGRASTLDFSRAGRLLWRACTTPAPETRSVEIYALEPIVSQQRQGTDSSVQLIPRRCTCQSESTHN
jgi:hypothetical protein